MVPIAAHATESGRGRATVARRDRAAPRSPAVGSPDAAGRSAEPVAQLDARGDAELGEDAVEVGADRARREEEPLADLPVGQPVGGHPGDLELLVGELVPVAAPGAARGHAGGT